MTLNQLMDTLVSLYQEIEKYKATGTKASSRRIRKTLGDIKRETPAIRKTLIEADKSGTIAE
jgi:hypothetical protein